MYSSFINFRNAWQHTYRSVFSQLNSGDTCTDFKFTGKIELSIDLFTRMFIGFDIDGCANFKIFGDIESYPVAFFIFNLLICLFTCSSVSLKLNSISSVLFSSIFIILGWLLSIFIFPSPMSLAPFIKKTIKNFWYFFWVVCNFQINTDFCIWTRKNGWAENRMNIPGFYIWTRKNRWAQTRIIIPDFCIWRRKNGWAQTCMINLDFCTWTWTNGRAENCMNIPDFYIWTRKNRWAQTRIIIPDFWIWTRKNGWAQTVWLSMISAYG